MSNYFDNFSNSRALKQNLDEVYSQLDDILVSHAGPFATNTVIGSKWRQMNDADEFTKDGIKILRHLIVDDDPVSRFAVRMARFIGIAVDKRCHDGTTTSMLLFSRLAKLAIEKMDTNIFSKERYLWWNSIKQLCEYCLTAINSLKITEDDLYQKAKDYGIETTLPEVRGAIAYHMAMISSKGDKDLSEKIAKIIKHSPKKIYGMYKTGTLPVETKERYILRKQEYDISVNANLGNREDYNHMSDTQYLSEDTVIFATGSDIVSSSWESAFLTAFISTNPRHRGNLLADFGVEKGWEELHEGKRRLIILSPLMNDPVLLEQIILFNRENPNCRISNFNIQVNHQVRTSFNKTLHYMAGVPLFKDVMMENATKSLIGLEGPKVKAHLIGHTLALYNLYEKTGEVYHPLYQYPERFEDYTTFCKETEDLIAFVQSNVTNPALDGEDLNTLISLYRTLTCQEIYDIDVGGNIHEQYANSTVYEDAIGAALSAIDDGVVLGGYAHLATMMNNASPTISQEVVSKARDIFIKLTADCVRANDCVISDYLGDLVDRWAYLVADKNSYLTSDDDDHVTSNRFDIDTMESFLACDNKYPILLQAWSGYDEQFKRFKDILPMLANTTDLADMRLKDGNDVR